MNTFNELDKKFQSSCGSRKLISIWNKREARKRSLLMKSTAMNIESEKDVIK